MVYRRLGFSHSSGQILDQCNENSRSRVLYFSGAKDVAAEWLPHVKVASNKDSTLNSRAIFYTSLHNSTLDRTVYLLYIYRIFLQGRLGMKQDGVGPVDSRPSID